MWRVVAAVLMVAIGGLLVLGAMGKARDQTSRQPGDVGRAGAQGFAIVVTLVTLTATVLPATLTWGVIIAGALIGGILMVTG